MYIHTYVPPQGFRLHLPTLGMYMLLPLSYTYIHVTQLICLMDSTILIDAPTSVDDTQSQSQPLKLTEAILIFLLSSHFLYISQPQPQPPISFLLVGWLVGCFRNATNYLGSPSKWIFAAAPDYLSYFFPWLFCMGRGKEGLAHEQGSSIRSSASGNYDIGT